MKINAWLAVVIGIAIGFAINKWNCNGGPDKELQFLRDSTARLKAQKEFTDSAYMLLKDENASLYKWAADTIKSLNRNLDTNDEQLSFTNLRIKNLIEANKADAIERHDTAKLLQVRLAEALFNQKNVQVKFIQVTDKQKDSIYAAEIVACQINSDKKDTLFSRLSLQYDTLAIMQEKTQVKAEKLASQNKKRFVVGPFIGITYENNFKPTYGIGITYQLFKF